MRHEAKRLHAALMELAHALFSAKKRSNRKAFRCSTPFLRALEVFHRKLAERERLRKLARRGQEARRVRRVCRCAFLILRKRE